MENADPKDNISANAAGATPCEAVCSMEGCGTLFGEVHKAIRVTLDELAMLAGLATADTDHAQETHVPEHTPSAYSLLLENSLFRR